MLKIKALNEKIHCCTRTTAMLSRSSGLYVRLDKLQGCPPKICINCKHYIPPKPCSSPDKNLGLCKYFGEVHLVTGEISYPFASAARDALCKGDMYTDTPIINKST